MSKKRTPTQDEARLKELRLMRLECAKEQAQRAIACVRHLERALNAVHAGIPSVFDPSVELDELDWNSSDNFRDAETKLSAVVTDSVEIHSILSPLVEEYHQLFREMGVERLCMGNCRANTAHEMALAIVESIVVEFFRGEFSPVGQDYVRMYQKNDSGLSDEDVKKEAEEKVSTNRDATKFLSRQLYKVLMSPMPTFPMLKDFEARIPVETAHAESLVNSGDAARILKPLAPIRLISDDSVAVVKGKVYLINYVAQQRVLRALVDAFPKRVTAAEMAGEGDVSDALEAFKKLMLISPYDQLLDPANKKGRKYGFKGTMTP